MMRETLYVEITLDRPEGPDAPRQDAGALADFLYGMFKSKFGYLHPRIDVADIREAEDGA